MSEPFDADKLIVSWVKELAPYVPGEQPQTQGWVKLNTNENPYPASPKIVELIQEQIDLPDFTQSQVARPYARRLLSNLIYHRIR